MENNQKYTGKKVFILNPHSVMHNELVMEIFKNGYEVYILKDHNKAAKLLKKYNNSILFINVDTVLKEKEWIEYVKSLMESSATKDVGIGILSYAENETLMKIYLMEMMVSCGYIKLKIGLPESLKIILQALKANEAKGLRKYMRADLRNESIYTFNTNLDGKTYRGRIIDMSVVGMAIVFDVEDKTVLKVNILIKDIQLRLKGTLCSVSGLLTGIRYSESNEKNLYLIMFDKNTIVKNREKINNFLYTYYQQEIDNEVNSL